MKILFIANKTSNHATRWANELARRGNEITFASVVNGTKRLDNNVEYIKLKYDKYHGYVLNYNHLKKIINKVEPDIVHAHYANGNALLGALSKFKPLIISVYGSDILIFPDKNVINKYLVKNVLAKANWVCSTSQVMKDKINSLCDIKSNISVIPFGVDLNIFRKRKITNNKDSNTVNIGTVKKIEKIYGIEILIKSFNKLLISLKENNSSLDVKLTIAGDGSLMNEMKELTSSLGIKKNVYFLGNVEHEQVPEILNNLDIFVALSRSESFGVSIVEASACELPVIVSNVGGLPEVVDDHITGLIVENENIDEAKDALLKLVNDKDLRIKMGKSGRNKVERNFNWQYNVDQMEEVYQRLV